MALFCSLLNLAACRTANAVSTNSTNPITMETPDTLTPVQRANACTFDLFKQVCAQSPAHDPKNIFLSPLSAFMALDIARQGADGETLQEMAFLPSVQPETTNQLKIANSMWVQPTFKVEPSFLAACEPFGMEIYNQWIKAKDVNSWAAKKTNNKIRNLLSDPLPETLRMILLNAIYFKAEWEDEFDKASTRDQKFYPTIAPAHNVKMMHRQGHMRYAENEYAQFLELPYKDCPYAMDIVLPKDSMSVEEMMKKSRLDALNFTYPEVVLSLPKVKMEYQCSLKQALNGLGIHAAFGQGANFSRLSKKEDVWIDDVVQKSFLAVDEAGTEAAAVTAVIMVGRAICPVKPEPKYMQVDHPFLLMLRDVETGLILFIGKIEDIKG